MKLQTLAERMPKPLRVVMSLVSALFAYVLWMFGLGQIISSLFDGIVLDGILTAAVFVGIFVCLVRVILGDTKYYFYVLNVCGLVGLISTFAP